jgi:hypothetical protein
MKKYELTPHSIQKVYQGSTDLTDFTCQILSVKNVTSPQGDRYRLVVSDGINYMQGVLLLISNGCDSAQQFVG